MVEKSIIFFIMSQGAVRKIVSFFSNFLGTGMYAPTSGARHVRPNRIDEVTFIPAERIVGTKTPSSVWGRPLC